MSIELQIRMDIIGALEFAKEVDKFLKSLRFDYATSYLQLFVQTSSKEFANKNNLGRDSIKRFSDLLARRENVLGDLSFLHILRYEKLYEPLCQKELNELSEQVIKALKLRLEQQTARIERILQ